MSAIRCVDRSISDQARSGVDGASDTRYEQSALRHCTGRGAFSVEVQRGVQRENAQMERPSMSEPLPEANIFWRHIKPADMVESRSNVFVVHYNEDGVSKSAVANWQSIDAREAQAWLRNRVKRDASRKCRTCGAPYTDGHECPNPAGSNSYV